MEDENQFQMLLSILYIAVCVCQCQPPLFVPPTPLFPGYHKFVFYICYSTSVIYVSTFAPFF